MRVGISEVIGGQVVATNWQQIKRNQIKRSRTRRATAPVSRLGSSSKAASPKLSSVIIAHQHVHRLPSDAFASCGHGAI